MGKTKKGSVLNLVKYYERDSVMQWGNHPKLGKNPYCSICNSNVCTIPNHIKVDTGVVIRIPKKNASKYKIKKFHTFLKKEFPNFDIKNPLN